MRIIVDAYNVILSEGRSASHRLSLREAREEIIAELLRYQKIRGHAVTLVFDATESGEVQETRELVGGVAVIFTKKGETADEAILDLVEAYSGSERIVVSSDMNVVRGARRRGAAAISSEEFLGKIEWALSGGVPEREETQKKPGHFLRREAISLSKL